MSCVVISDCREICWAMHQWSPWRQARASAYRAAYPACALDALLRRLAADGWGGFGGVPLVSGSPDEGAMPGPGDYRLECRWREGGCGGGAPYRAYCR